MNVHGKRNLLSTITALMCIVLYAATIAFGFGRILINMGERTRLAEQEFADIHDSVSSVSAVHGFMTQPYQEAIQDILLDTQTILGVIITGSGMEGDFERQPGTVIETVGTTLRFKKGFGISGEPYYRAVAIRGQRNATVQAVYGYLDYDLFIRVLKETLIIIFAVMMLAVFILVLDMNLKAQAAAKARQSIIRETEDIIRKAGIKIENALDEAEASSLSEPSSLSEADFSKLDFSAPADVLVDDDSDNVDEAPLDDFFTIDDDVPESNTKTGTEYPKGLYSPKGIGWESYTKERLESELHRCASIEEDLSFIEIQAVNNDLDDESFSLLIHECAGFFTLRDMIFENGSQGLSLIVPSLAVDEGFAKAEEFRKRVREQLTDNGGIELCIGLSSRAGRLVEAERLMMESAEALSKALAAPPSVVAFKSDPEKYRDFIRERT